MIEILFRGRDKDCNWHYGDLVHEAFNGSNTIPFGIQPTSCCCPFEVIPDTVGQFIGVKGYTGNYEDRHKNEVRLFDGDIVEAYSEGVKGMFVIKYRVEATPSYILYPAYQSGKTWSIHGSDLGRAKDDYFDDLKVIGNIHDNPELIKKEVKP